MSPNKSSNKSSSNRSSSSGMFDFFASPGVVVVVVDVVVSDLKRDQKSSVRNGRRILFVVRNCEPLQKVALDVTDLTLTFDQIEKLASFSRR